MSCSFFWKPCFTHKELAKHVCRCLCTLLCVNLNHLFFFFLIQFWDDPWWWGEPLSQDRREHYVSHSGRKQRGLLLVHLQPTVPQPFPWVGLNPACKCTNTVKFAIQLSLLTFWLTRHGTGGLLCSPEQPRHPVWWTSPSRSVSTSTLNSFPGSCMTQTRSASGSLAPRPNFAALILSRWDIHFIIINKLLTFFLRVYSCFNLKKCILTVTTWLLVCKGVHSYWRTHSELSSDFVVPLSSMELYSIFKLIVLDLLPTNLLFWLTVTALISVVF